MKLKRKVRKEIKKAKQRGIKYVSVFEVERADGKPSISLQKQFPKESLFDLQLVAEELIEKGILR